MAAGTIDSVDIEITASSDSAVRKINSIIDAMQEIKRKSSNFHRFSSITSGIKAIGDACSEAERKVSSLIQKIKEMGAETRSIKGFSMKQIFNETGGAFNGWDAEQLMNMGQYEQLDRRLGILMSKMEEAAARGNDLQALNYAQQANKIQAQLSALENTANHTAKRFDNLRESIKKSADNSLIKGFKHLEAAIKRIVLYRAIRSGLQYISSGFQEGLKNAYKYSQLVGGDLAATLDRLTGAGETLKNQLGSAFGGLIQAAEPVLLRIIDLATTAANALSQMMAALGGKDYYKKATPQVKQFIETEQEASKATKELKRQLLGFDEINRLESIDSFDTGAGSKIDTSGIKDAFNYTEISDFWKKISDLFSNLKFSIKDVFFDWKDLNPEQIAEKAVVGLCGLLGGVTGFMLGGVPGAIVGTLTGVGIGLLIDSVIFNHDGVLSRSEISSMLTGALYGLAGGVIGFFAGGPTGALVGASIGVGLFASLKTIDFLADGKYGNLIDQLATALTALAGGMIGFAVGGPVGAALGAVVGIGISGIINSLKFDITDPKYSQYKNGMSWFICGVLGLPTDEEWATWGKNVVRWIGEGFSGFTDELHWLIADPIERTMENVKKFVRGKLDEIKKLFNVTWSFPKIKMPHFSWTWQSIGKYVQIPKISVDWYAKGGFPEDGLFMANHNELVGQFTNGKTAVANNEQITEGIAIAVYGAFTRAFAEAGGNGNAQQGDIVLKVNDREFARATYPAFRAVAKEKGISMISNFA